MIFTEWTTPHDIYCLPHELLLLPHSSYNDAVFVAAAENVCPMFESGDIFGSSRLRWLENVWRILFAAFSIAIFDSTRVTINQNDTKLLLSTTEQENV